MAKPVLWQIKSKDTNWGPGCAENIARYFERQNGYKIRALVVQGEPVAWSYEFFSDKWIKMISENKPDDTRGDVRDIRPLFE